MGLRPPKTIQPQVDLELYELWVGFLQQQVVTDGATTLSCEFKAVIVIHVLQPGALGFLTDVIGKARQFRCASSRLSADPVHCSEELVAYFAPNALRLLEASAKVIDVELQVSAGAGEGPRRPIVGGIDWPRACRDPPDSTSPEADFPKLLERAARVVLHRDVHPCRAESRPLRPGEVATRATPAPGRYE